MMSLNLIGICAFVFVFLASFQQSTAETDKGVCGPALDAALTSICENGYNTKFKKSMEWDSRGLNELVEELPFPYGNSPFLGKIHGAHFNTLAKTRLRRGGVYDECCNKGCTYNEILTYCNQFAN